MASRSLGYADEAGRWIARERGWQTLAQSLLIDVVVAVGLVLVDVLNPAGRFQDVDWMVLLFLVLKSVLSAAVAWLVRRRQLSGGSPVVAGVAADGPDDYDGTK